MDNLIDWQPLIQFLNALYGIDYLLILLSVLLIVFAKPCVRFVFRRSASEAQLKWRAGFLRLLNILVLLTYGYRFLSVPAGQSGYALKVLSIAVIVYLAYLTSNILSYFIYKHYGRHREFNGKTLVGETYQTRLFTLLSNIFITIITLISVIQQLGFQSLLETGGVLGFIGVMLALTQASWAPDIISGLIILNSDLFEEGDVVELENGRKTLGTVFKTKVFHTEILNLVNNHRIMIRNAALRDQTVHNLSKFASSKGLRECLSFKIGYAVNPSECKKMFEQAFAAMVEQGVPLAEQFGYDVKVLNTGDHAVEWGFIYYVKDVEKLISIRRDAMEIILKTATAASISLATPLTHQVKPSRTATAKTPE